MSIGIGCYQGALFDVVAACRGSLFLVMLNPKLATMLREADPYAVIGLRPDWGKDWEQVDASRAPEDEARRWALDVIAPAIAAVMIGTYNFTAGINEPLGLPLDWLARFEHRLCRHVQYGEAMPAGWRQLPYAALSGQVGYLEPWEVPAFREVIEDAWALNFHVYLKEWVKGLLLEPDDCYVWRPVRLLWPEVVKINPRAMLLVGECGTFYAPEVTGISREDEARVQVAIAEAYELEAAKRGYRFVGAICYGIGTLGDQDRWNLSGQTAIFAAANAGREPLPPPAPPPGGDTVDSDELTRWAADVFKRAGVPFNPNAALVRYWLDSARRGRYLGRPEGPEHPSETGIPYQEFAGAVLYWKDGIVYEGLPFR